MKQGDFTNLAKQYANRPSYSNFLLKNLLKVINYSELKNDFSVVEVGAGTGKLTKMLLEMNLHVIAVEPNDQMREQGILYTKNFSNVKWLKGSGEKTNLETSIANWVIMASSFHWTDPKKSLPEFGRILKKDGYFTAIWNTRNIEISDFHKKIENEIKRIVPELQRVSSGSQSTKKWEYIITSTNDFENCLFMETDYNENMSKDRYLGAWKSVNDIQAQAGEKRWGDIIKMIENEISLLDNIDVPYKIRSWTCKKV